MNIELIDEAIDKYVAERMKQTQQAASERFLTYVHLRHRGDELADFLKRVRGLSRYYVDYLKVMHNPFKGPELAWLASMLTVAIYALEILVAFLQAYVFAILTCIYLNRNATG